VNIVKRPIDITWKKYMVFVTYSFAINREYFLYEGCCIVHVVVQQKRKTVSKL